MANFFFFFLLLIFFFTSVKISKDYPAKYYKDNNKSLNKDKKQRLFGYKKNNAIKKKLSNIISIVYKICLKQVDVLRKDKNLFD